MTKPFSRFIYGILILALAGLASCKSGPFNILKPASPHEIYLRKLMNSGLSESAMGKTWIDIADNSIQAPVAIKIPYLEKGYFTPEKAQAAAFSFQMEQGQKLQVKLSKKPANNFMIYTDVWEQAKDGSLKILASGDTLAGIIRSEISITGTYVLRVQPELLAGGEFTLEITSGPSLEYPLKTYQNNQIRSVFGDGRDAGVRKHEGIDIFSAFRTPLLAIADGVVRVNENNLGGKVVWLRPEGRDFTLYYAHLDEQIVQDGQMVRIGDTLGRMGNTGNARTTPPHLHFGVYTREGAVDPLPFINPKIPEPPTVRSETSFVNSTMRTSGNASLNSVSTGAPLLLKSGTIVKIIAASANEYRIELPDGKTGYLRANKISDTLKPLSKLRITAGQQVLFDQPDSTAAAKLTLKTGQLVAILGTFGDYQFVENADKQKGWIVR
jgi:murein DD-endopeptidase MepM/ murein hydrolase activator NlpD